MTYVATCGGVTRSGELEASDDGVVAMLFSMDNNLACGSAGENDSLQLGPITDGGWHWITDETNSAVGSLVSLDVLDNETTEITSAGPGVTMTAGKGAVLLKETASGRVGILSTILAVPEMDPVPVNTCGHTGTARKTTNCMLGDGGTVIAALGPNGGSITRPGAPGTSATVTFSLWGNGSGHYTTDAAGMANLGHAGGTALSVPSTARVAASVRPRAPRWS